MITVITEEPKNLVEREVDSLSLTTTLVAPVVNYNLHKDWKATHIC